MPRSIANRIVREKDGTQWCPDCGSCLTDERSHKHLGALFAFLKFVWENWPEESNFSADNPEHLRAYLLVRIGHRQPVHVFRFANKREQQLVAGFLDEQMRADRARGEYGWPTIMDGGIAILRPASIAFDKISEKKFTEVTAALFKEVYDLTGIDFDAWKEGQPRRAA